MNDGNVLDADTAVVELSQGVDAGMEDPNAREIHGTVGHEKFAAVGIGRSVQEGFQTDPFSELLTHVAHSNVVLSGSTVYAVPDS